MPTKVANFFTGSEVMLRHLLFIYDNNDFIDIGESM
jgi:hypothetical protein